METSGEIRLLKLENIELLNDIDQTQQCGNSLGNDRRVCAALHSHVKFHNEQHIQPCIDHCGNDQKI